MESVASFLFLIYVMQSGFITTVLEIRNQSIVGSRYSDLSKGCHIDDKPILHIALQQAFVGLVDLLNPDEFNVGGDPSLPPQKSSISCVSLDPPIVEPAS